MQTEEKVRSTHLRGENLVGSTFGWLKVIAPAERPPEGSRKARGSWWLCRCRCGNEKIVARGYLVQKNVTSCGCKKRGPKSSDNLIPAIRFTGQPEQKAANIKLASSCSGLATECLCANCGKTFDRLSEKWVYKTTIGTRLHWFCSWKCLRAAEPVQAAGRSTCLNGWREAIRPTNESDCLQSPSVAAIDFVKGCRNRR